ncbi:MAG: thiol-disulfide oxidoreductase DCC family protein [Bacteroidia bacterium]
MTKNVILLFDGECNLCNGTVQFVIKRDKKAIIKFASLQSEIGKQLMQKFNIPTEYIDSIILVENNKVFYKSTAALRLSKKMDGLWPLIYVFIIIPAFIRNFVYDFIARNRIKWFGKADSCWVMTLELRERFIEKYY